MPLNIGTLHFVGIGGIGMSGIAEILHALGYHVQGSDIKESANVKRLKDKGIRIAIGHDAENIKDADGAFPAATVISSAVKQDNPELVASRENKVPVIRRAEMLAELMRLKWAFAIGGTHGKTTTTSMVGEMLIHAGFDPTVINGGIVNSLGSNTCLGQSEWMVVEADESDGTFTRLPASVAVITNMDPEHMEHYGSFENVRKAYRQFILNLPFYGYAVLCVDHPEVQALIPSVSDRRLITYGFSSQADVRAVNIRMDARGSTFDVAVADWLIGEGQSGIISDIRLAVLGEHNVQNALAAVAIGVELGLSAEQIRGALAAFNGVKRRFTETGVVGGVRIFDDYAHHPVEIQTVLKTARSALEEPGSKVVAVMQPHRYSRLNDLFEEFCTCFNNADTVIVTDVYEAGESPIEGRDKKALVEGILSHGHKHALALDKADELARVVSEHVRCGDIVVCLGAGDITALAYQLPEELGALMPDDGKIISIKGAGS